MLIQELVEASELQAIQDAFADACNLSSVVVTPDSQPVTRFSNATEFCSLIQSTEKGKRACTESLRQMASAAVRDRQARICYCFAGGGHCVAPILVQGEHCASMFAGQFIPEAFTEADLARLDATATDLGLAPAALTREARHMRVVPEASVLKYSRLLANIVHSIAEQGARTLQARRAQREQQQAHELLERKARELQEQLELVNSQNLLIRRQAEAIRELSLPVLRVWESVLVLPIVGVLDTRRGAELMQTVLQKASHEQAECVIIDVTGVEVVDTKVADHLMKVSHAIELIGARCIMTGLRPAVAQTLVEIGVDLSSISTKATLEEGLKACIRGPRRGRST